MKTLLLNNVSDFRPKVPVTAKQKLVTSKQNPVTAKQKAVTAK